MKKYIEPFKKTWQFLLASVGVGLIIAFLTADELFEGPLEFFIVTFWSTLIVVTQWFGHSFLQTKIGERFSWIDYPGKRLVLTIISIVGYSVLAFMIVQVTMTFLVVGKVPTYLFTFNLKVWGMPVGISFVISLIVAFYGLFVNEKQAVLRQEELKRQMLEYKYDALKNQINPHFMFNSLNVLTDIVYTDQKLAVEFIQQFSQIYHYVIDHRDSELVPLDEELDFIDKFVFLLKIRFENKLDVKIQVEPKPNEMVVPLSLQLLIENAVKHNEISKSNPLTIHVTRNVDTVVVTNSLKLKACIEHSKKVGLKNLEQQYSYFTDRELKISKTKQSFSVELPILKSS